MATKITTDHKWRQFNGATYHGRFGDCQLVRLRRTKREG
jgi:hypothetical protein